MLGQGAPGARSCSGGMPARRVLAHLGTPRRDPLTPAGASTPTLSHRQRASLPLATAGDRTWCIFIVIKSPKNARLPVKKSPKIPQTGIAARALREVGDGSGGRRAAGAAAETRGRKARCDPVRWIGQPSKRRCACRGDPAAGPFDFSAVRACHHRWTAAPAAPGAAQECS